MWFRYDDTNPLNFAAQWCRWERQHPCPELTRDAWPACSPKGSEEYFTPAAATEGLATLMGACIGADAAASKSWHSLRVTLASALLAKRTPDGAQANGDGTIQAIVRWKTVESMRIYARMLPNEYADRVEEASRTDVAPNLQDELPPIGPEEAIAEMTAICDQLDATPIRPPKTAPRHSDPPQASAGGGADDKAGPPAKKTKKAQTGRPVGRPKKARPTEEAAKQPPAATDTALQGKRCLVPAEVWPEEPCAEHGGEGWEGRIISRRGGTSLVQLCHCVTAQGGRFAPVRLLTKVLRPL